MAIELRGFVARALAVLLMGASGVHAGEDEAATAQANDPLR
jgi:hypothetical protein